MMKFRSRRPSEFYGDLNTVQRTSVAAPCVVCGDKSTGKHYGAHSCEGCKGFFKRCVRLKMVFACSADKKCVVDIQHRNQCQYCRFQKCIRVGMKKEAVQKGRSAVRSYSPVWRPSSRPGADDGDAKHSSLFFVSRLVSAESFSMKTLQQITSVELEHKAGALENVGVNLWREIAVQILFSAVRWARNTYAFPTLDFEDQVTLLKYTWSEIFVLNAVTCIFDIPLTEIAAAAERCTGRGLEMRELLSKTEEFRRTVEALKELQPDISEVACLKAIALFTRDAPGISDCVRIETIQEGCQTALHHYVKEQGSNNLNRFNRLLLRLPSVRAVDGSVLEKVLFSSLVGNVSIKELITDMLTSDPDCNEMSEQRLRMRAR